MAGEVADVEIEKRIYGEVRESVDAVAQRDDAQDMVKEDEVRGIKDRSDGHEDSEPDVGPVLPMSVVGHERSQPENAYHERHDGNEVCYHRGKSR